MSMKFKAYWVTCTGALSNHEGNYDHDDKELQPFLARLTHQLSVAKRTHVPAVLTYGDGTIILTSVLEAPTSGVALDVARAAYLEAIAAAGGTSDLDGDDGPGNDDGWHAARLLRWENETVREVDATVGAA